MALNEVPCTMGATPAQRAVQSIFDEVYTKLLKKQIEKRNEDPHKVFKLKLKHYEAFALSEILTQARECLPMDCVFERNALLKINFQIFKQL